MNEVDDEYSEAHQLLPLYTKPQETEHSEIRMTLKKELRASQTAFASSP